MSFSYSEPLAVTSRSFSKNEILRGKIKSLYSDVKFNDTGKNLTPDETVDFLKGYQHAIVSLEKIDHKVLSGLPNLKLLSKYGVGLDNLDYFSLRDREIQLGWKKGVNRRSVSELALMMILQCVRMAHASSRFLEDGKWNQVPGRLLTGKTIGILGLGMIGQDLCALLENFGVEIQYFDLQDRSALTRAKRVSWEEFLKTSDVISVHVPRYSKTLNLLSRKEFSLMKKGAILVNTARGGIVDENALEEYLTTGHFSSAAMDVFLEEPAANPALLSMSNFLGTPHIGGNAFEAILAMGEAAISGLQEAKPIEYWKEEFYIEDEK